MKALPGKNKMAGGIDWMEKRRKARKVFDRIKGPISSKLHGEDLTRAIHQRNRDFESWFTSQNHCERLSKKWSVDAQAREAGYHLMRATKVLEYILGQFDEAYGAKEVHDFEPAFLGDISGVLAENELKRQIERFHGLMAKIDLEPPQRDVKDITPKAAGELE